MIKVGGWLRAGRNLNEIGHDRVAYPAVSLRVALSPEILSRSRGNTIVTRYRKASSRYSADRDRGIVKPSTNRKHMTEGEERLLALNFLHRDVDLSYQHYWLGMKSLPFSKVFPTHRLESAGQLVNDKREWVHSNGNV